MDDVSLASVLCCGMSCQDNNGCRVGKGFEGCDWGLLKVMSLSRF